MPTPLQEKLADAIIKDAKNPRPKSAKRLLKSVEYSEATAHGHAKEILNAEGLKKALEIKGFTKEAADQVVLDVLHGKKIKAHDKLDAADKIYKRTGAYAPEKRASIIIQVPINPDKKKEVDEALGSFLNGK